MSKNLICAEAEKEKVGQKIGKYFLNRLIIAGCTGPLIKGQFVEMAEANVINRYEAEFLDLMVLEKEKTEGAVSIMERGVASDASSQRGCL